MCAWQAYQRSRSAVPCQSSDGRACVCRLLPVSAGVSFQKLGSKQGVPKGCTLVSFWAPRNVPQVPLNWDLSGS